jgi:predicted transcriptional regulator
MATTIHLPAELLEQVDRRASELGVSRNRYIREAVEAALDAERRWSPNFLDSLRDAAEDRDLQTATEEMMRRIRSGRRSRNRPPRL